ncbi:hypothetical protein FB451DRAFT_1176189 [Mycena latifolia]|nr:hypothetical protein FB451DRAFT_1176189 [Mycena latifolia]
MYPQSLPERRRTLSTTQWLLLDGGQPVRCLTKGMDFPLFPELPRLPPGVSRQDKIDKFWKQVAKLTTTHAQKERRIGTDEVRTWNSPSLKRSCDRKTQFTFDMTKNDFFPTIEEFLAVYTDRSPVKIRSEKQMENRRRRKISKLTDPASPTQACGSLNTSWPSHSQDGGSNRHRPIIDPTAQPRNKQIPAEPKQQIRRRVYRRKMRLVNSKHIPCPSGR